MKQFKDQKIFKNNFILLFKDKIIETMYRNNQKQQIKIYLKYILLCLSITLIIFGSVVFIKYPNHASLPPKIVKRQYLIYTMGVIYITFTIFTFVPKLAKNTSLMRIINNISILCIALSFSAFRYYMVIVFNLDLTYYFQHTFVEFLLRIFWISIGLQDFSYYCLMTISSLILQWIFSIGDGLTELGNLRMMSYSLILMVSIIISYFITRKEKLIMYYTYKTQQKCAYYENII